MNDIEDKSTVRCGSGSSSTSPSDIRWDILASVRTRFELTPEGAQERGSAPAEQRLVNGNPDRVGVIVSVTRPF